MVESGNLTRKAISLVKTPAGQPKRQGCPAARIKAGQKDGNAAQAQLECLQHRWTRAAIELRDSNVVARQLMAVMAQRHLEARVEIRAVRPTPGRVVAIDRDIATSHAPHATSSR